MRRPLLLAGALAAVALAAAAAPSRAAGPLPGRVVCSGGQTLVPIARAWGQALQGRVAVHVDASARLAADGFHKLLAGAADCALFVREPFPREEAAFRARFGHGPLLVPVALGSFATLGGTHAIAIYVNAANPIRGLTLAQLRAAFSAGGEAKTWGDLGLSGEWAQRPLHLYGMAPLRPSGDPPGVVNFFERRVLRGANFRRGVAEQVDRPGEQALAAIVRKVAEDPDGLGYSGFGYARPGARAVPIASQLGATFGAGAAFVAGSPASVATAAYPLTRHVYILVDRTPGRRLAPALRAFLAYALSPAGQAAVAADPEGFLPLPPSEAAQARALLR